MKVLRNLIAFNGQVKKIISSYLFINNSVILR
jgi:hypothetical protein